MAMRPSGIIIYLAAGITTIVLFQLFARLDIWFSALFWSPSAGWFLGDWPPFQLLYHAVPWIARVIVLLLLLGVAIGTLYRRYLPGLGQQELIYLLVMTVIGPGLLANTILKDHWGRARPGQIVEFGGSAHFTPALEPAHECTANCSFVSGHGAMAFSLVAFAFLLPLPYRRWGIAAALTFGAAVALARIAQGGHFLSDNIYAALLMIGLAWLLHRWIVAHAGLQGFRLRGSRASYGAVVSVLARLRTRRQLSSLVPHAAAALAILIAVLLVDRPLARYFHSQHDRLTQWFEWISQFGLGLGWMLASGGATIILYAVSRSARFAHLAERARAWALLSGFVFASTTLAGLAADLIKILLGRTRPKLWFADGSFGLTGLAWRADHWSFPSGHTVTAAAVAAAIGYIWPRYASACWLLAGLIALSRVGTAQHFLSDTIAGLWLGAVVTAYVYRVLRRSGIDLEDAKAGIIPPLAGISWRYRLLGVR